MASAQNLHHSPGMIAGNSITAPNLAMARVLPVRGLVGIKEELFVDIVTTG